MFPATRAKGGVVVAERHTRLVVMLAVGVATVLGALASTAVPSEAPAQEGAATFDPPGKEPPPRLKDYAYHNGEVYVDGDEVLDCRSFVKDFENGYDEWGDQAQAKHVLELCKQAGMPSVAPPPEVQEEIREDRLSETGGPPLPLYAAGLLLACLAFLIGSVHQSS